MSCQFNTDCEGPITRNDNAFEMSEQFMPSGGKFFTKISRYDDFLAEIERKPNYKAGDTLKLILPFLKAFGVTDGDMREFSAKSVLIMPKADRAIRFINSIMPTFIISTSYRPYIDALCKLIEFPEENTYCTEVSLDRYYISSAEIKYLQDLYFEILNLPEIEIPREAVSKSELPESSLTCIERLDQIFWHEISMMSCGLMLKEVNTVGGYEKVNAIVKSCERTGNKLSDVLYVGDSITDTRAMVAVSSAGGVSVSFNGNRYAIEFADIACISGDALILSALAVSFSQGVDLKDLALHWQERRDTFQDQMQEVLPDFSCHDSELYLVKGSDKEELISRSERFRKSIRGERIGQLG